MLTSSLLLQETLLNSPGRLCVIFPKVLVTLVLLRLYSNGDSWSRLICEIIICKSLDRAYYCKAIADMTNKCTALNLQSRLEYFLRTNKGIRILGGRYYCYAYYYSYYITPKIYTVTSLFQNVLVPLITDRWTVPDVKTGGEIWNFFVVRNDNEITYNQYCCLFKMAAARKWLV